MHSCGLGSCFCSHIQYSPFLMPWGFSYLGWGPTNVCTLTAGGQLLERLVWEGQHACSGCYSCLKFPCRWQIKNLSLGNSHLSLWLIRYHSSQIRLGRKAGGIYWDEMLIRKNTVLYAGGSGFHPAYTCQYSVRMNIDLHKKYIYMTN